MKRLKFALGAVLVLLCLAPLAPASAKDKWTSVRSKNFVLVGTASEKEIRQVATRLEQFRDVFTRLLNRANFNSSVPTTVVVFKDFESYRKFAPPNTAGYFQGGEDTNYIALSTQSGEGDDSFQTIFHEFVHLLVKDNVQNMPVWFNEGLAEYYSTFQIKGDDQRKVWLGKVLSRHVYTLREQKLIPLQKLFAVDHSSPYYNEKSKMTLFYAESWALVHYLLLNAQRKPQLDRFLSLILSGTDPDKAFPQAFQTDYATIERELKEYVKHDTYPSQVATFEHKLEFDLEMQSAPLAEAEGEFYLGDLMVHFGALDEAQKHLEKAVKLDENLALAYASLGMMEMRREHFAEAKRYLERAVSANAGSYLVHYYYAYILSREVFGQGRIVYKIDTELAVKMRSELKKAIELNPSYADSYRLLAIVNFINDEELDETIALLKRGMELQPGEQEFGFMLGQIYLRKHDYKAAREQLEPIARSSSTEAEMRSHAQQLLNTIKMVEEQTTRYKGSDGIPAGEGVVIVTDSPAEDGTPPRTSEEMLAAALEESLHKPQAGEVRVQGQFLRIDCNAKGATFVIQAGDRQLKLAAGDMSGVQLTSFVEGLAGDITCGTRKKTEAVVVVYRPSKDGKGGEVVSVEFVPKDFKLKQ